MLKDKIEIAREFAYSKFTKEERKIIEETDIDRCCDTEAVYLINKWFSIYHKKLNELK